MRLELKIVELLAKDTEKKFTINEIAKTLDEYYSFVHRFVNKLNKDNIIIKTKAGKSHLCSLNINNEKTLALLQLSEIRKKEKFYAENKELKLILEDFTKSAESAGNITAIILFGSYAKGDAKKDSDMDILIISRNGFEPEKITKEIYAKYGKETNPVVMTTSDFRKQTDRAVVRDIIKNHCVLFGAENFVSLVFKK